jgi:hypothetical protein
MSTSRRSFLSMLGAAAAAATVGATGSELPYEAQFGDAATSGAPAAIPFPPRVFRGESEKEYRERTGWQYEFRLGRPVISEWMMPYIVWPFQAQSDTGL